MTPKPCGDLGGVGGLILMLWKNSQSDFDVMEKFSGRSHRCPTSTTFRPALDGKPLPMPQARPSWSGRCDSAANTACETRNASKMALSNPVMLTAVDRQRQIVHLPPLTTRSTQLYGRTKLDGRAPLVMVCA